MELSLAVKLRGEAVLPALWVFFLPLSQGLSVCFRCALYFALLGDDASLDESGNSDRGSSSSSHFSEKLGYDDHAVRFDGKEILRRKLQGKTVHVN